MKKIIAVYNKVKKYIIIIGSVVCSILLIILSLFGYKAISKKRLSNKEKKLKKEHTELKEQEDEVKKNVKKIKDNHADIISDINNITDKLTGKN